MYIALANVHVNTNAELMYDNANKIFFCCEPKADQISLTSLNNMF